jgi:hypothetical protein
VLLLCREPYVGFKVLVSGYTGTNPWGAADTAQQAAPSADSNTAAKGVPSGLYTFWQDPNAFDIGVQYAPPDAANFQTVQQCLDACSDDRLCAGITIDETVDRTKVR